MRLRKCLAAPWLLRPCYSFQYNILGMAERKIICLGQKMSDKNNHVLGSVSVNQAIQIILTTTINKDQQH